MRLLKYIILLIVLLFAGILVYIATKDGQYATQKSRIIPLDKSTLYNYVNEFKNWEDFFDLKSENPDVKFLYSKKTNGIDGSFTWESSNGKGSMTSIYIKEADSIAYTFLNSGTNSNAYITFKDTVGGTKVTFASQDDLGFVSKITSFFKGDIEKKVTKLFENSLEKLEASLTYETKVFSVKIDGPTIFNSTYYIYQTVSSKVEDVHAQASRILPKLSEFVTSNDLVSKDKPFLRYHNPDFSSGRVTYSVCIPLTTEIFTTPESQYNSGIIERFSTLKTTYSGDYSHFLKAWKQGIAYVKENNLQENHHGDYLEVFTKNNSDTRKPSEWLTNVYVPIGSGVEKEKTTVNIQTQQPSEH